jgi:hypothetical protein
MARGEATAGPPSRERGDLVLQLATAFWAPRCLHVVAELGVADHLDDAPRTAAELAEAVGANPDALNRVMRLLVSYGVFASQDNGYTHNSASRTLRSDHPRSKRAYVRFSGSKTNWAGWGALEKSVRTGKPAAHIAGGPFAALGNDPQAASLFDEAMTAKAHGDVAAILPAYDFHSAGTIADIGGGRGHLLRAILERTPSAQGIVFDLPHVVARLQPSERVQTAGGDFFKDKLPPANIYLVMNVLHDWDDDRSTTILRNIGAAAPAGARLLVIEALLPAGPEPHWSKTLDINMLRIGGRERTEAEYAALLSVADFRVASVIGTESPYSIIEALGA